jgi:hypothetical protein
MGIGIFPHFFKLKEPHDKYVYIDYYLMNQIV